MKRTKASKLIAVVLATVVALLVTALAAACDDKTPPPATPTKLLLDYSDVKVDYVYDEPFTYAGLKVSVEMSDGTKQDVTTGYKVTPPEMTPGQHTVTVTYGELSAKYPIYVDDVTKSYDDADAFTINGSGVYVAEAEAIDLTKCVAEPLEAGEPFVRRTSTVFAANGKYLRNFGAAGNCIGASFTANKQYDDVSLVVTLGNMTDTDLDLSENTSMYFGFSGSDDTGELDLGGVTLESNSWKSLVFDGLTVPGYGNFIMEFTGDCDIVWDSFKVIVGADDVHSDSSVSVSSNSDNPAVIETEDMNTEKLVTNESVVQANNLKFGQPMLNGFTGDGTGKYVSDLKTGTKISTIVNVDENSVVSFKFAADVPASYKLSENWKFTLDTFTFDNITDPSSAGWTEVDLGAYPVKAGAHLFTAELVGKSCNADKFTFAAVPFDGDANTLVEDVSDKDLIVYSLGAFKVEAEDMLDRSGWIPEFGTVDGMVEAWRHKDGKNGYSIGKVGRTKIVDPEDPEKFSYINTELKFNLLLKTKAKLILKMNVADSNPVEGGSIPSGRIATSVAGKKLTFSSDHKFGFTDDKTYWNFGEIVYSAIVLDPGEYTISTKTVGIGYDWYELEFYDPTIDVEVDGFGTYRAEAENLLNRDGWIPNGNKSDGTPNNVDDMIIGSYVSKIGSNSQFKIVFDLDTRAAVKISARLSAWKHDNNNFQSYWMSAGKIDGTSITFKGKPGSKFKDPSETGSVNGWGIAESGYVTLEAGKHEVVWKSGDVSYDWFEIHAYDPDGLLPELSIDEFGSYRIVATNLSTMANSDRQWVGGDVGNAVNNVANKRFSVIFEIAQKSEVKLSIRLGKYGYPSETYDPAWLKNTSLEDASLGFAQQAGSSFKGSTWAWGVIESDTVTLDAGIYEFSWTSGDVAYHWFTVDVTASEE